jgi:uncharacterized protein YbjT (DUF2867 family)
MKYAVTGAFSFSGKYIARRLLDAGHTVITLTHVTDRPQPFGDRIEAYPFNFDQPDRLTASLRGVDVLVNTYWVRFNYGKVFNHARAIEQTRVMFRAAQDAGVRRVVHVSITNPDINSPVEYFRGKAQLEQDLIGTGLSYAILRPAVLFGQEDVLINNIAWSLRRLPVFGIFGDGTYRLQPIYVDDFAQLAVEQSTGSDNTITNAIGPETFTYRELVRTLAAIMGKRRLVIGVPPVLGYAAGLVIGRLMGDVMITWPEVKGLMSEWLYVDTPPTGETRLTDWAREHADQLGRHHANELARRRRSGS